MFARPGFHHRHLFTSILIPILLLLPLAAHADEAWWDGFGRADLSGMDNNVHDVIEYEGELYAAGMFDYVGSTVICSIARWDGIAWNPVGSGILGTGTVYALAVYDGKLIVGGTFTAAGGVAANNIATWDGENWGAMGDGFNTSVYALAVHDGTLYAGGYFQVSGGTLISRIASWDGGAWSQVGDGLDDAVLALHVHDGQLIAGGDFMSSGLAAAHHVGVWDGSSWSQWDSGVGGRVNALATYGGNLIAAGYFTSASDVLCSGLAQWDGVVWSPVGGGTVATVYALHVRDGLLYAGGNFTGMVGLGAHYIATWDGSAWATVGVDNLDSDVTCFTDFGGDLIVGGRFSTGGGGPADRIARWNNGWHELLAGGKGLDDDAVAMTYYQGELVVAGRYVSAAGWPGAAHIGSWDGSSWSHFGSGFNGPVLALAAMGDTLIAAGSFTSAGGTAVSNVARWYGSAWHAMGSGFNQWVNDLEFYDGHLVAAGGFWVADGNSASRVALWDGATWQPLGDGLNTTANALQQYGDDLWVVGQFTEAGGAPASHIARWDGESWETPGAGFSGADGYYDYWDLFLFEDQLVVGGKFTAIDGVTAHNLAVWDGESWGTFGGGVPVTAVDSKVFALGRYGSDLVIGGLFNAAGGVMANNIALWDGAAWSPLGDGVAGEEPAVLCLTGFDGSLYVGGDFETAGGTESLNIARWTGDISPVLLSRFALTPLPVGVRLDWSASGADGVAQFRLERQRGEAIEEIAWAAVGPDLYSAVDDAPLLAEGGRVEYRLFGRELTENWTLLARESIEIGQSLESPRLLGTFPNPFNPMCTLRLHMPAAGQARVAIHDAAGRRVATLHDGSLERGVHDLVWRGLNDQGESMASGVYFARLETEGRSESRELILLR